MKRSIACLVLVLAMLTAVPLTATAADPAPTEFVDWAPALAYVHHVPLTAGTGISASTFLRSGNDPVQWQPVRLEAAPAGQSTFTTVATGQTDGNGHLYVQPPVLYSSTTYRWAYDGDGAFAPAVSPPWTELVQPAITVHISDRTPRIGQRIVVRGRTVPVRSGRRVSVWTGPRDCWCDVFYAPGEAPTWKRLARGVVRADGSYRLVIRFATQGKKRIHMRVAGGGGLAAGESAYRYLRVL